MPLFPYKSAGVWPHGLSAMKPQIWRLSDQAHLLHKVILLQWLNQAPEKPSGVDLLSSQPGKNGVLKILLASNMKRTWQKDSRSLQQNWWPPSNSCSMPEGGEYRRYITARLAVNNSSLDKVMVSSTRDGENLRTDCVNIECYTHCHHPRCLSWKTWDRYTIEQEWYTLLHEVVILTRNRILNRLRSRHAKLHCDFKENILQRPKFIWQPCKAINSQLEARTSGIAPALIIYSSCKLQDTLAVDRYRGSSDIRSTTQRRVGNSPAFGDD